MIRHHFGVAYHTEHVRKIIRRGLNWGCQKPQKQARQCNGEDTVAFLGPLRAAIRGPMIILWDQSKIHERSGAVKMYLAKHLLEQ